MKYAIWAAFDQTVLFVTKDGEWTTKHPEATLFDDEITASLVLDAYDGDGIEEVTDVTEFRARKDTW